MTADEADKYFVEFIERWRIAFGDLKDFFLAGHSFGGYICGHYATKYHHNIRKLLMLSPAGVCLKPEQFRISGIVRSNKGPKFLLKLAVKSWENKWSPFGIMRKSGGWIGNKMIKTYINKRLGDSIKEEEFEDVLEYFH